MFCQPKCPYTAYRPTVWRFRSVLRLIILGKGWEGFREGYLVPKITKSASHCEEQRMTIGEITRRKGLATVWQLANNDTQSTVWGVSGKKTVPYLFSNNSVNVPTGIGIHVPVAVWPDFLPVLVSRIVYIIIIDSFQGFVPLTRAPAVWIAARVWSDKSASYNYICIYILYTCVLWLCI